MFRFLAGLAVAALLAAPSPAAEPAYLVELPGRATTVRYAPGSLDRAAHLQARFELLAAEMERVWGEPVAVLLFVLPRREWKEAGLERPYGLPEAYGGGVAVAAAGDAGTVGLWRRILGGDLPATPGVALGGAPAEVASLVALDALAQVEGARALMRSAGVTAEAAWLEELAAHALARSAFGRHEEGRLAELRTLFRSLSALAEGPLPPPEEGLAAATGLVERLAWEGRFFLAADSLVGERGTRVARRLVRPARKGESLAVEPVLERHPELAAWLETFAPPAP